MTTLSTPPATALDWTALATQAAPFTDLVTTTDPVSGLVDVTYYGLRTTLSQVLQHAPATGLHSVAVFADTLVLDVARVPAAGLLLVARVLDVSGLAGQPLVLAPDKGDALAQVLVGVAAGGPFQLAVAGQEASAVTPPVGTGVPQVTTYVASPGEALRPLPSQGGPAALDLLGSGWMMNTLHASFSAAAWLMDETAKDAATTAQAMLAWVVACTASLAKNGTLPTDYAQLYNQAAGLLVTLNVAPGATFVPVLSGTYYSQHTSDIIAVLRDYEANAATLDTQADISQAVATVSATLQAVASDEVTPLQVQLASISANTDALFDDIRDLRNQFQLQTQRAHTAFLVMSDEAALAAIRATLEAALDMTLSGISLGFDAVKAYEGDVGALKDAINDAVQALQGLVNTIEAGQGGGGGDDFSAQAASLLQSQIAVLQVVLNARLLYQQAMTNQSGGVLPASLAAITIDPATSWDNYLAEAQAEIESIKRNIGAGAQSAADNYLASLQILAGYGKAIGSKCVAYIAQLVQATIVIAQIKAAKDVEQRWADTQAAASSEAEKLAALKALVQGRMQALKRSLYLAWTYYAASYFYLNFQSPPRVLRLDMSAAELEAALVGVADWVAQATSSTPDGQHVQLPSNSAAIELDFQVLQQGGASATDNGDAALLSKLADGSWALAFTVPLGSDQLNGVLPNQGNVAIWLSEAAFFLDGITPNSKGNVIAVVSTSGTYQNGFGPARGYTFVTKGLSGNYAYRAADKSVYSSWVINSAVYMTPTPYTQWTIALAANAGDPSTATRLRVVLKVAYATS